MQNSDAHTPNESTSPADLQRHVMDSNIAKSETDWWSRQQIFTLVVALQELTKAAEAVGIEGEAIDLAKSATKQFEGNIY